MKTCSINVRVEKELLEQLQSFNVNISELVRKALRLEVESIRRQRLKENMTIASAALKKISMAQIVKDIREMRESR